MSVIDKIKKLIPTLDKNDGSQDVAEGFIQDIEDSKEMDALLLNSAFKKILGKMKSDFTSRIDELVKQDSELRAMRRMFVRCVGRKGTEERVQAYISSYIDSPEEES